MSEKKTENEATDPKTGASLSEVGSTAGSVIWTAEASCCSETCHHVFPPVAVLYGSRAIACCPKCKRTMLLPIAPYKVAPVFTPNNNRPTPETDNQAEYAKDCGPYEELVLASRRECVRLRAMLATMTELAKELLAERAWHATEPRAGYQAEYERLKADCDKANAEHDTRHEA